MDVSEDAVIEHLIGAELLELAEALLSDSDYRYLLDYLSAPPSRHKRPSKRLQRILDALREAYEHQ